MSARVRKREVIKLAIAVVFFCMAPTAGDIGSCGQRADELDPTRFFGAKQNLDCQRCDECKLTSKACARACEPALEQTDFPKGCAPLVHDGEVCLHALQYASCSAYRGYTADEGATAPTECNFCPPGGP